MDSITCPAEYLKHGLKSFGMRSKNDNRRTTQFVRLNKRDEMRAGNRVITGSPLPPTPLKQLRPFTKPLNLLQSTDVKAHGDMCTVEKPEPVSKAKVVDQKGLKRKEQLQRWRAEREKKREAEKAKKPIFKTSTHIDRSNRIYSQNPATPEHYQFASHKHKFKPPKNVQSIALDGRLAPVVPAPAPTVSTQRVTRQTKPVTQVIKKYNLRGNNAVASGSRLETDVTRAPPNAKSSKTDGQQDGHKTVPKSKTVPKKKDQKEPVSEEILNKPTTTIKGDVKVKSAKSSQFDTNQKVDDKLSKTPAKNIHKNKDVTHRKKPVPEEIPIDLTTFSNLSEDNLSATNICLNSDVKGKKSQNLKSSKNNGVQQEESKMSKTVAKKTPKKTLLEDDLKKSIPEKTPKLKKSRRSCGRTPKRKSVTNWKKEQDAALKEDDDKATGISTVEDTHDEQLKSEDSFKSAVSSVYECGSESLLNTTYELVPNTQTDTPEKTPPSIVYVSPFVTMSRGKNSARKEYHARSSKGGMSTESPGTGTIATSRYFYKLLEDEIARITKLCDKWEQYKSQDLPEEACEMIDVPLGQSQLLISKKMRQFRELIDRSISPNPEDLPIMCTDLHGFWDTVLILVDNLNQRFANLDRLEANAWAEVLPNAAPEESEKAIQKPKVKRVLPKRNAKTATSKLRDAIRAARATKNLQPPDNGSSGAFKAIIPPTKSPGTPVAKTPKMSLRKSVLSGQNRKTVGSPGLAMMRATQMARNEMSPVQVAECTPKKSILRVATPKSLVKKAVVFKADEAEVLPYVAEAEDWHLCDNNIENDGNVGNCGLGDAVYPDPLDDPKPIRRTSRRLSKLEECQ